MTRGARRRPRGAVAAGGGGEVDAVAHDVGVDGDGFGAGLHGEDGGGVDDLADGCGLLPAGEAAGEDLGLLGGVGVADGEADHEAVELGLGQGVGAFVLDGVGGGEDVEGVGQGAAGAFDGDLAFGHGLEECGLGLGGGAVDLVGEEEAGEDGAGAELEGAGGGVEHGGAGDVCGEQVGGALQAGEVEPEAVARERAARVLPRPGTSSNRTWPPARMVASAVWSASRMPTTAVPTSARTWSPRAATWATGSALFGSGTVLLGGGRGCARTLLWCGAGPRRSIASSQVCTVRAVGGWPDMSWRRTAAPSRRSASGRAGDRRVDAVGAEPVGGEGPYAAHDPVGDEAVAAEHGPAEVGHVVPPARADLVTVRGHSGSSVVVSVAAHRTLIAQARATAAVACDRPRTFQNTSPAAHRTAMTVTVTTRCHFQDLMPDPLRAGRAVPAGRGPAPAPSRRRACPGCGRCPRAPRGPGRRRGGRWAGR